MRRCKERPQPSWLRLVLRSERAGVDVHCTLYTQNGEAHCSRCALTEWRVERSWVCIVLRWRVLRAGQAMCCTGSREAAQLVEARPQLVVSTAALRHQLVGGGPGSYSFFTAYLV